MGCRITKMQKQNTTTTTFKNTNTKKNQQMNSNKRSFRATRMSKKSKNCTNQRPSDIYFANIYSYARHFHGARIRVTLNTLLFAVALLCLHGYCSCPHLYFLHLESSNLHVVVNMACCVCRSLVEHINAMA